MSQELNQIWTIRNLPELSARTAAAELLARRMARKNLASFTKYLSLGFDPARHHELLIEKLEAVESGKIKRLMVFMPPGSAKSTYASILFPAWFLGRNSSKSVLASSHTTELAERFGRRVRNILSDKPYKNVFDTRLAQDSQAAGRWATSQGGEYYAAGIGSAILGYRADLGIIDDPVAGREQADSELERAKTWEWYKSDFYTRLKPGAAIVLIMQRWREDDLAGMLLDDANKGGDHWEILRLPMEAEENDPLGRKSGEPLWPEWFTGEMREQAKRDARNWMALYQQTPRPESGGEFKKPWLRHYRSKPTKGLNTYILVDPASEKRKTSDYTAIWVIGLSEDGNTYAIDIIRDKLNLTERGAILFKLHRQYKPLKVGYEKYGMQADVEYMKDKMEREQYRFEITELGGSLKKEDRIRRLIPLFEQGKFWLPESHHYTDHQGQVRDLVKDFIEEEYAPFPVGRHDDMLDCLARIEDSMLGTVFPKPKKKETTGERMNYGSQGWMG